MISPFGLSLDLTLDRNYTLIVLSQYILSLFFPVAKVLHSSLLFVDSNNNYDTYVWDRLGQPHPSAFPLRTTAPALTVAVVPP